ncbi:MAG: hypothetical protein Fur0022_20290 [Anaerolineales bacterium]
MKQYIRPLIFITTFVFVAFGIMALIDTNVFAAFDDEFPESEVLTYIASRENVPIDVLEIAYVTQTRFELLGKDFWAVKVDDRENHQTYGVWVDMVDGSFTDDIEALQLAETEAYHAKYGKLDVALWELLQNMRDEETVIVAIWVTGEPIISQEEIYAELAAIYPEVQTALELTGNLDWLEVDDPDRINEIENAYTEILARDIQERIQPLVGELEAQGYSVQKFNLLPSVIVSLPKRVILEFVQRSDVGSIERADEPVEAQLDTAVPSSDVPVVWERGFNGVGVDIGIVEPGRIDFTPSGNFLIQGNARTCSYPYGPPNHKTFVASVAASSYSGLKGVAPGAEIDDACADSSYPADVVEALEWAMTTSDPINASIGIPNGNALHFLDKAFDYYVGQAPILGDTIVVPAGNPDTYTPQMYVTSPGKA